MFWKEFATRTALRDTIRGIVTPKPFGIAFESSLLSDLIVERHYFCSLHGLRPSRFRKLAGYGAYILQGDFSGLPTPEPIGWHDVSWTKCLIPPLTNWDRIVRAMRDRCEPIKAQYRKLHPVCEACRSRPSVEAHHRSPTFKEICNSVRQHVSEEDVTGALGGWNWFRRENFTLPEGHRITALFDGLHASAQLEALCRQCHNKTKRRKPESVGS